VPERDVFPFQACRLPLAENSANVRTAGLSLNKQNFFQGCFLKRWIRLCQQLSIFSLILLRMTELTGTYFGIRSENMERLQKR
jgi:hypothetical protein